MRPALLVLALLCALGCRARGGDARGLPAEGESRVRRRTLPDATLHTVEVGAPRGAVRLVIHGGPGLDHTYLRPWLDALADRARLVYVDLRGHGRSGAPADPAGYTIAAAATDLASLISELSDDAPADVIAHDFGAEVALELAAAHPERVRRLVLVDPVWRPQQLRTMSARTRAALGDAGWRRIDALSTPQGTLRDPRNVTELFRRLGRMWWRTQPSEAVFARMGRDLRYSALADERFLGEALGWDGGLRADEVRAPALVIAGAADLTTVPAEARALAERLPHGRYAEIPDAGHCPFIEQPARFLAVTAGFLRGTTGSE